MSRTLNPAAPRLIRVAGIVDFVLSIAFIATPMIRARMGDALAYFIAAFLLVGSAASFWIARRMDAQLAAGTISAPTSATSA